MQRIRIILSISLIYSISFVSCVQNSQFQFTYKKVATISDVVSTKDDQNQPFSNDTETNTPATTKTERTGLKDDWNTFTHPHGFTIQLPKYFTVGSMTSSGIQYYKTAINDQISLGVETFGGGRKEIVRDYQMRLTETDGVTYKTLKQNWFVVTGEDADGIYYFKEVATSGTIQSLLLQYPPDQKKLMDSILPRISRSFH